MEHPDTSQLPKQAPVSPAPPKPSAGKKKKKKRLQTVLLFLLLFLLALACIGIILYPMISNLYSDQMQSRLQLNYEEKLSVVDNSALEAVLEAARAYNMRLSSVYSFGKNMERVDLDDYESILDPTGTGIMAYVRIPLIDVNLPVYHGSNLTNLEKGVVHLLGTSFPVGGESTHAALSAHTGLASNKLFTDLEAIELDDVFYIHVCKEILAYQVVRIDVVDPSDTSLLGIYPGEDYVTLITCTPYGINSHRLLVRGKRIPYQKAVQIEEEIRKTKTEVPSQWENMYLRGILYGLGGALFLILLIVLLNQFRKRAKKARDRHEKTK